MNSGIDSSVDRRHLLVDVLRHRIEGGGWHINRHERERDSAERKRNRHA